MTKMMKGMGGPAWAGALLLALAPMSAAAQDAPPPRERAEMRGDGPGVEMILRMRERLELNEDQIVQLNRIREAAVARRAAHQAEMAELRSRVMAGEADREVLREAMEARREAARAVREDQRREIEAVLNEAQREKLTEMRERMQDRMRGGAERPGRGHALRGPRGGREMAGGPGAGRRTRGLGSGPGGGWRGR
ncbi:MAG: hypothetical protein OEZ65_09215 [Gemmatimonadota bacterium]|nr:hypothetical protein [Gemmatimonadota bacterium]MDH5759753.1 hypothetical protein [Gemmatimonadota bacterium]